MMEAMMTTNSGKPIGRWPEETQALALISDTYDLVSGSDFILMLRRTMPIPGWQPVGAREGLRGTCQTSTRRAASCETISRRPGKARNCSVRLWTDERRTCRAIARRAKADCFHRPLALIPDSLTALERRPRARPPLRIGTRKSAMALAQTDEVARLLRSANPGLDVEIVKFETRGDQDQTSKLLRHGGKGGAFVAEIRAGHARRRIAGRDAFAERRARQ